MTCSVPTCERAVKSRGFCGMHLQRFYKYGDTERRMKNWHSGSCRHGQGYVRVHVGNNKYRMEHVVIAEKALGKPLPKGAVVHHVDGDPAANRKPWNLVVCPNQDYHLLLHRRAQALGYEPVGGFKMTSKRKAR